MHVCLSVVANYRLNRTICLEFHLSINAYCFAFLSLGCHLGCTGFLMLCVLHVLAILAFALAKTAVVQMSKRWLVFIGFQQ